MVQSFRAEFFSSSEKLLIKVLIVMCNAFLWFKALFCNVAGSCIYQLYPVAQSSQPSYGDCHGHKCMVYKPGPLMFHSCFSHWTIFLFNFYTQNLWTHAARWVGCNSMNLAYLLSDCCCGGFQHIFVWLGSNWRYCKWAIKTGQTAWISINYNYSEIARVCEKGWGSWNKPGTSGEPVLKPVWVPFHGTLLYPMLALFLS